MHKTERGYAKAERQIGKIFSCIWYVVCFCTWAERSRESHYLHSHLQEQSRGLALAEAEEPLVNDVGQVFASEAFHLYHMISFREHDHLKPQS